MSQQRTIEIFSAGCPLCDEVITAVLSEACLSCRAVVSVLGEPVIAERARTLGVARAPTVLIDGALTDCCHGGVSLPRLRELGLGQRPC